MVSLLGSLDEPLHRALAGFVLALAVAIVATRARSLSISGAVATTFVGGSVVAGAGWWAGLTLIVYFVTASVLSSLAGRMQSQSEQARGKQRDALQVLANGGITAGLSLTSLLTGNPTWLVIAAMSAVAGAAADTWATEIGRISQSTPRLVTTWRTVAAGTSGAISVAGTGASLAGAALIGVFASLGSSADLAVSTLSPAQVVVVLTVAGILGSLVDSLLGATVQERRWCATCERPTEQRVHRCGTPTIHAGGLEWMTNDLVNVLAVAAAAIVGGIGTVILA